MGVFIDKKGFLGKISLFSIALLAIILVLIFILPVFAASSTSSVTPNTTYVGTNNQIFNFTISNTDSSENITQVNITWPPLFNFTAGSNATTASNTISSSNTYWVVWDNTTTQGFIANGTTQYFSLNVTAANQAGIYNFSIITTDTVDATDGNDVSFIVYGYANISCLFEYSGYSMARVGDTFTTECYVSDNVTNWGVENYNITLYNGTAMVDSATTNSTGWAVLSLTAPSSEISFTITANISDNTSIYYYRTAPFSTSTTFFASNQINPRPLVLVSSDLTVTNIPGGWGQIRDNYSFPLPFVVPNFTGGQFSGMVASSNIYAPLTYQNEMFFKAPTMMDMFAYNLTFNVTYSSSGPQIFNVTTAMPQMDPSQWGRYKNQTVLPARYITFSQPDHMKFDNLSEDYSPPDMTFLMKSPDDFSLNITNGTVTWTINGSQNFNISNMPAPNASFDRGKLVINFSGEASQTYTVSVLFGTQDVSCFDDFPGGMQNFSDENFRIFCEQRIGNDPNAPPIGPPKTESTPAYITEQTIAGTNIFASEPGDAPPVNTSLITSFIVNVTNPLLNYTGNNLFAEFRYPLNITEWNGTWYTSNEGNMSFNISENHQMYWWNETAGSWKILSASTTPYMNRTGGCTNMTDDMPDSPMNGVNMTICFMTILFNLNQTVPGDTGRLDNAWVFEADVRLNVTVSNIFKIINQATSTNSSFGAPSSSNWYNATIVGGQSTGGSTGGASAAQSSAGMFTFNDTLLPNISQACASGLDASQCDNITVFVNGQQYLNWSTGSLVLTSQSAGAQVISISYSVPALPGDDDDGNGDFTPGGGGGTIPIVRRVTRTTGKVDITVESISADRTLDVTITKTEDMAIRKISMSTLTALNNIQMTIRKLTGMPATISHSIDGKVYHYININQINFTDADINNTIIKFAVTKEWLSDNNIAIPDISLYRWEGNRWNELPTTNVSTTSVDILYEAESPGFSVFVIGQSGTAPELEEPEECSESWSCTEWSECADETQTRTCTDANDCGTTADVPTQSQSCEEVIEAEIVGLPMWALISIGIVFVIAVILLVLKLLGRLDTYSVRSFFRMD